MAYRIKNKWHRPRGEEAVHKSLGENAGALAYIAWRLALESAKDISAEGFRYDSDRQRVAVISEFCGFLLQYADRLVYPRYGENDRAVFVNTLAHRLADQMQENLAEIAGPGNYRAPFIALLNERLSDYANFSFADQEPGFDCLRYVGDRVLRVMGNDQTNRWVIDQVMEISAPRMVADLRKSLENLL